MSRRSPPSSLEIMMSSFSSKVRPRSLSHLVTRPLVESAGIKDMTFTAADIASVRSEGCCVKTAWLVVHLNREERCDEKPDRVWLCTGHGPPVAFRSSTVEACVFFTYCLTAALTAGAGNRAFLRLRGGRSFIQPPGSSVISWTNNDLGGHFSGRM